MIVIESGETVIGRLKTALESQEEEQILEEIHSIIRWTGLLSPDHCHEQNLKQLLPLEFFSVFFTCILSNISKVLNSSCLRVMSRAMYHVSRLNLATTSRSWNFVYHARFVVVVQDFMQSEDIAIRLDCWYFLQQIAGSYYLAHPVLHNFVSEAQQTINDELLEENLRGRAVRFCSHLACHPENRTALLKWNLPESLKLVMNSGNTRIGSTSATVAVSVLIGEDLTITHEHVQDDILSAFRCSIQRLPYPPQSRIYPSSWRYAMAILSLSRNSHNKSWLIEKDILSLIKLCLSECSDPRARTSSINILWNLSKT